jgi:hypothetical protein
MEISNIKELQIAIAQLENKKLVQKELLTDHFHETYEHFKPINLIKNAISNIDLSPSSVGGTLTSAAISAGAGMLSKKLFVGKSNNIFKRILGLAIELGVANIVAKNSDGIKETGLNFLKKFMDRNRQADEYDYE